MGHSIFLACRARQIAALALALLLGACGTLPDLKPFADATGDIQSGVAAVGTDFAASIPPSLNCTGGPCVTVFEKTWQPRVEAVKAIADYSDALAQIVDSGRAGADTANRVLDSAGKLLGTLGAAPLSAPVVKAAQLGLTKLAEARALRSLDEAISAAHGPISQVVALLDADLKDLGSTVDVMTLAAENAIKEPADATIAAQLNVQLAALHQNRDAVARYQKMMTSDHFLMSRDATNLALLRANETIKTGGCASISACENAIAETDKRITSTRERLVALERDLQALEKSYAPTQVKVDAVRARGARMKAGIANLRMGLQEWVVVHRGLGDDVKRSLRPNVRALVATGQQIKKIVEELRSTP